MNLRNLLLFLIVVVFICYCLYNPSSSNTVYPNTVYPNEDIVNYETDPRRMKLENLQRETRLMGFGMGPGLVDSRRHHVIA